eukprot:6205454-Pleurochrysis_carterae.AAC.3
MARSPILNMGSIFRGNRYHVNPSCRSDASEGSSRGVILYTPPAALVAPKYPPKRTFADL